ncbi:hypothetical protein [Ethanoligenens sp.]|uniref:hypothetical protein n=1 Tax=Ethanoligenens sp. TaxID=2099655 RepID=UPI0039EC5519
MNEQYYNDILKICLAVERKEQLLEKFTLQSYQANKSLLEKYVDCITDVFCKFGLKSDDEPNKCGLVLEDVINYYNNLIYDLETT